MSLRVWAGIPLTCLVAAPCCGRVTAQVLRLQGNDGPPGMCPEGERIRLLGGMSGAMVMSAVEMVHLSCFGGASDSSLLSRQLLEPWLSADKEWERDRALQGSAQLLAACREAVYCRVSMG